jgi:hypothetical protein
MERIETQIEIDASAEVVWTVLADFGSYPQWNPFIRSIEGVPREGQRLKVRIQPDGEAGMTFRPVVLRADTGRQLRWLGKLLVRGLFDGEHSFTIERVSTNQSRLIHSETFTGLLVPFLANKLRTSTRAGFEKMNTALKRRAENGVRRAAGGA